MNQYILAIILCLFSLALPVIRAMDPVTAIFNCLGECCSCCKEAMPKIIKLGESVMYERDVKNMKIKLIQLQKEHPHVFKGLIKKCLDQEFDIKTVTAHQHLLVRGFIKPNYEDLVECVRDAVFALVVDQNGEPLSNIIVVSSSTLKGGDSGPSVSTQRKMNKKPEDIDSISLKILDRKAALALGHMRESDQKELVSFKSNQSQGSIQTLGSLALHSGCPPVCRQSSPTDRDSHDTARPNEHGSCDGTGEPFGNAHLYDPEGYPGEPFDDDAPRLHPGEKWE